MGTVIIQRRLFVASPTPGLTLRWLLPLCAGCLPILDQRLTMRGPCKGGVSDDAKEADFEPRVLSRHHETQQT